MGHRPGLEWRATQAPARAEGWSRRDVIEYENHATHYQLEDPSKAGLQAAGAGVGAWLGGVIGVGACGALAVGTGGVGALACGAIVAGAAAGGSWFAETVAGAAHDTFGGVRDVANTVGNAVESAFDAITFWDN